MESPCVLHLPGQNVIRRTNLATRVTDHIVLTNKISVKINGKYRIGFGWPLYTRLHRISPNIMLLLSPCTFSQRSSNCLPSPSSTIRLATRLTLHLLLVKLITPSTALYKLISHHLTNCAVLTCLHHSLTLKDN